MHIVPGMYYRASYVTKKKKKKMYSFMECLIKKKTKNKHIKSKLSNATK